MSLWRLRGGNRSTRHEETLFVDAPSPNDAIRSASGRSLLVTDCDPATPEETQAHQANGKPRAPTPRANRGAEPYADILKNARRLRRYGWVIACFGWLGLLVTGFLVVGLVTAKNGAAQMEALLELVGSAITTVLLLALAALLRLLAGIGIAIRDTCLKPASP